LEILLNEKKRPALGERLEILSRYGVSSPSDLDGSLLDVYISFTGPPRSFTLLNLNQSQKKVLTDHKNRIDNTPIHKTQQSFTPQPNKKNSSGTPEKQQIFL